MQLQDTHGVVSIPALRYLYQRPTHHIALMGGEAPAGGTHGIQYPEVPVPVNQTKASALDGLEPDVLPWHR